ncbi:MAG: hypothetical protein WDN06_10430 [Asticcacaulis sp.]
MSKQIDANFKIAVVTGTCLWGLLAFCPAYAVRPANPDLLRLQHAVDVADQNLDQAQWALSDADVALTQAENAYYGCSGDCGNQFETYTGSLAAYNQALDTEFQAETDDELAQERLREYEEGFGS